MPRTVQLFVTCLSEQFQPTVLENMVKIFAHLGISVDFPPQQTCCGQPFFNSGFQSQARNLARKWLDEFSKSDSPIVAPSGSCVDMVRHHYPGLFPEGTPEHQQANELARRTYEFSQFMVDELKITDVGATYHHKVTYHASCHLLRGMGVHDQPLELLKNVRGLDLVPMEDATTCCGFGGIFSVVYPEVSQSMMEAKVKNIITSGAEVVTAGDTGCLMNIGGGLLKVGSSVKAIHIIDILASGLGTK